MVGERWQVEDGEIVGYKKGNFKFFVDSIVIVFLEFLVYIFMVILVF